ncbi:MAG: adenylyl-sulfate reductase subunit alpha [Megasphaera sp.]|jgi:adenylylsulfate reductase subunit A|nr:adenylyl-sulfate reductase subunit alpha [Megasphaera sp.]
MEIKKQRIIHTDVLIIGGGTAGCYAALTLQNQSDLQVLIAEKANICRSGCLAAGVNALNAYITPGHTPQSYADYAKKDAAGIVREDLLLTMAERLNAVTASLEKLGLVILKDEQGNYVARGARNIKINGENIKPILAHAVEACPQVTIFNHLNMTAYIVKKNTILGAVGFDMTTGTAYEIRARYVLCATGGAAGLYRPNHPGFSRHKMWYPPFNTGAGYAMGIRAGAEMTTFEMRFIALRCKDTIAPTGTIAQGVGAKQINSHGTIYEQTYGLTTAQRVYGTVQETLAGRGPCYLHTTGITTDQEDELFKAYLNMAPGQTLRWIESGESPSRQDVEIEGTEPYIVGGHTASGYWVDTQRQTTIRGLYAAGDVAGGCPQKYVTGALAEGEIAAQAMIASSKEEPIVTAAEEAQFLTDTTAAYNRILANHQSLYSTDELEEAMQTIMDTYAGGIGSHYQYNENQLALADTKIKQLERLCTSVSAKDLHELLFVYELRERLTVCRVVIAHLRARKETRWHSFAENLDYPATEDTWQKYVNSKMENGTIHILFRPLIQGGDTYEHTH